MSLKFINAEKHINDTLVFPPFDLSLKEGKVIAIHSSVNVREQLINLLLGNTPLSTGDIRIGEDDISKSQQNIGFLFLSDGLYERLSIEESLTFYKRLYDSCKSVDEIIKRVQLEAKRKVRVKLLSHSEKKRVQFACVLIQNPDVFILEEPDQNLDSESKQIFLSILHQLRSLRKSIFLLTGNMESAVTAADEIYRLDEKGLHSIHIETELNNGSESSDEESKAINLIQPVRFEKIPTKVNEKIVLFDPPEIDYVESNDGPIFLHIKGESFPTVFTLNELEERLIPFGFFRCHRSYIVNLQKVREVITWTRNSFSLILDDKEKSAVPLSKSRMVDLKKMLGLK